MDDSKCGMAEWRCVRSKLLCWRKCDSLRLERKRIACHTGLVVMLLLIFGIVGCGVPFAEATTAFSGATASVSTSAGAVPPATPGQTVMALSGLSEAALAGQTEAIPAERSAADDLPVQTGNALLTECTSNDGTLVVESDALPVLVLPSFSQARLDFRLDGQVPGAVVEIVVPLDLSDLSWEDEEAVKAESARFEVPGIRLNVTDVSDLNGMRVSGRTVICGEASADFGAAVSGDTDSEGDREVFQIRVAKVSPEGALTFAISIGDNERQARGRMRVGAVRVHQVEDQHDYVRLESADGSVRMTLRSVDVQASEVPADRLQHWIDQLSEFNSGMRNMGATERAGSLPVELIATETFDYQGLAGDPIYMNADILGANLAKLRPDGPVEQRNLLWSCVHEMGHLCDMELSTGAPSPWNFDSELLATLRAIRVISETGGGLGDDGFVGDRIPERFSAERKAFGNGIYSSEGFMCRLMEISRDADQRSPWRLLEQTLAACAAVEGSASGYPGRGMSESEIASMVVDPTSEEAVDARFRAFLTVFEQQLGARLSDRMTDAEWRAVVAKFHYVQ